MNASRTPSRRSVPCVRRIEAVSVAAAWGAPSLFERFTDRPDAVDGVEAELWYGAHAKHPSTVIHATGAVSAVELPEDERPKFLVKLIAVGAPLSIQVHPDGEQAARGYAAEESAGVPLDAVHRRYGDPEGKPEMIRALTAMRVLCGLRPANETRALLSRLVPQGGDVLLEMLARGDAGLADAVESLMHADRRTADALLTAVADGAHRVLTTIAESAPGETPIEPALERAARLALDLQERFPGDIGAVVALLMDDCDLAQGEALWVAPGTPHAYLSGLGLEVMGLSDNVLRAGLTQKPVHTDEFLAVLDGSALRAPHVGTLPRRATGAGWRRWILPSNEFGLDEATFEGTLEVERSGAESALVLCVAGHTAVIGADGSRVDLEPGGAALLSPGGERVTLEGEATVVHASRLSRSP